ncbi:heme peroxidase [Russula earlei]|uniref:Heme peroxidase n=1 Tax=Russula earlei TaxID=71964 RepID=A0ACC0TZ45_9AGAM|nr:heme peroxidase [Russula earlei]
MSVRAVDAVFDGLQSAAQLWSTSRAPVDSYGAHQIPSLFEREIEEIKNVIENGPALTPGELPAYIDAVASLGDNIDDRKLLLEKILTLMAKLGTDSEFSSRLQHVVINILYKDLPHPPSSYLALPPVSPLITDKNQPGHATPSLRISYLYRSADGSYYNPLIPTLGMAGSPYARTVPPRRPLPRAALPPADLIFDALLKRDKFEKHPGGISSLFFAFADIIIHNIFHTDHSSEGWSMNKSSSYLDLSPLYGTSLDQVNSVRKRDGTGRLKEDVFADGRLINMPPAVGALLVIFNRNHNYVAERILSINENGTFSKSAVCDAQDEEIFQRARLVNTGYFVQIILRDYVGAILGLARDGFPWRLDPLANTREFNHEVSPRGQGNVVSVEFNLLYRWHAAISEPDVRWTENIFAKAGIDPNTIEPQEFAKKAEKMLPTGPLEGWTFGGLTRHQHGRFRDADLAKILQDATTASASAFKARGTPQVLRVIELLSIEQGRTWGTCTLNEFRKFIGLKPYANFLDWNGNEEIANAAAALYHDIDNLELYVGLQAEEAKKPGPGAGLCPGYTISRAILADAVALTRGDRFLTVDFTPQNLTTWGFDDCQANTSDGSYGGMLTKLLFRHLPDHYPVSSTYAHFPFLVPEKMREYAQSHSGNVYTWDRPAVPAGPTLPAKTYSDVQELLAQPGIFDTGVEDRLDILTGGVHPNIAPVEEVLTKKKALDRTADAFKIITKDLIHKKKHKGINPYLDVVRDVINLVPVHWLSNYIIGLPLKTTTNRLGTFAEEELYASLATITNYVYCNTDRSNEWFLREQSRNAIHKIEPFLKGHLARLTRRSVNIEGITDSVLRWVAMRNDHSDNFLEELVKATGSSAGNSALDGLVGSVLASVVPTAALFSKIIAHVVVFYLDKNREHQREQIVYLVESHDNAKVIPFIFEALRLSPPLSSALLSARSPGNFGNTVVAQGQHVLASFVDATPEAPACVADQDTTTRVEAALGLDCRGLLSPKLFEQVAPVFLREIFSLKHLRCYPGQSGRSQLHTENTQSGHEQFYTDVSGHVTPFPGSLLVQFDVED